MKVTFDPKKNADNIRDRQLPFDEVAKLDWSSAVVIEDVRKDYGERRFRVLGYIFGLYRRSSLRGCVYPARRCCTCDQFQEG